MIFEKKLAFRNVSYLKHSFCVDIYICNFIKEGRKALTDLETSLNLLTSIHTIINVEAVHSRKIDPIM